MRVSYDQASTSGAAWAHRLPDIAHGPPRTPPAPSPSVSLSLPPSLPPLQYCSEVKALFKTLAVPATVVELDQLADGDEVAAGVAEVSGRRTVPQVFIGGAHVGGCDGERGRGVGG